MILPTHPALPRVIQVLSESQQSTEELAWVFCTHKLLPSVTMSLPPSVTEHRQHCLLLSDLSVTSTQRLARERPKHISSLPELEAHIKVELSGSCPSSSGQTQHTMDCKRRQTERTADWSLLFSHQSCCVGSILATGTEVCKNTEFSQ